MLTEREVSASIGGTAYSSTGDKIGTVEHFFVDDRTGVYWAGRSTLCGDPEHLRPYDLAFEAWFGGRLARTPRDPRQRQRAATVAALADGPPGGRQDEADRPDEEHVRAAASATEVNRMVRIGGSPG